MIFIRFINSYLPFNSLPTHTWQSGLCFCIQRKRSRDQAGTRHQYKKLMIFGYDKNCMKRSSKNKLFTNSNKSDMFYSLVLDWMQSMVWVMIEMIFRGGRGKKEKGWELIVWLTKIKHYLINQSTGWKIWKILNMHLFWYLRWKRWKQRFLVFWKILLVAQLFDVCRDGASHYWLEIGMCGVLHNRLHSLLNWKTNPKGFWPLKSHPSNIRWGG